MVLDFNAKRMHRFLNKLEEATTPKEKAKIKGQILRFFDADLFEFHFGDFVLTDKVFIGMVKRVLEGRNPRDVYREMVSIKKA